MIPGTTAFVGLSVLGGWMNRQADNARFSFKVIDYGGAASPTVTITSTMKSQLPLTRSVGGVLGVGSRAVVIVWLVVNALAALLPAACACQNLQHPLRVSGMPGAIQYPPSQSAGQVYFVRVEGLQAKRLCLTNDKGFAPATHCDFVPLSDGQFRFDAASEGTGASLLLGGVSGECYVVGFLADGSRQESASIPYSIARIPDKHWIALLGNRKDRAVSAKSGDRVWCDLRDIERILWCYDPGEDLAAAQAVAGSAVYDLRVDNFRRTAELIVSQECKAAWAKAGLLRVVTGAYSIDFMENPLRLDLPGQETTFSIPQRAVACVPGSDGYLNVTLGYITGGQVPTMVKGIDNTPVVPQRIMKPGDAVVFALGDPARHMCYVLKLQRLSERMIGDDMAHFTVRSAGESECIEKVFADNMWPKSMGLASRLFIAQSGQVREKEWSVVKVLVLRVGGRPWGGTREDQELKALSDKISKALGTQQTYVTAKVLEVHTCGNHRGALFREVRRTDLTPGSSIQLYSSKARMLEDIRSGDEYWMVMGPPVSSELTSMVLGGGTLSYIEHYWPTEGSGR